MVSKIILEFQIASAVFAEEIFLVIPSVAYSNVRITFTELKRMNKISIGEEKLIFKSNEIRKSVC